MDKKVISRRHTIVKSLNWLLVVCQHVSTIFGSFKFKRPWRPGAKSWQQYVEIIKNITYYKF